MELFKFLKKDKAPLWLIFGFLLFSLLGFIDALYLTVKHYQGEIPPCTIIDGCEAVITSPYAQIFGIPVALLGVLYYLTVFILALTYFDTRNVRILKLLPFLTAAGFVASLYFVFLQLFVIKAICLYCMGSAVTSTILFGLGIFAIKYVKT